MCNFGGFQGLQTAANTWQVISTFQGNSPQQLALMVLHCWGELEHLELSRKRVENASSGGHLAVTQPKRTTATKRCLKITESCFLRDLTEVWTCDNVSAAAARLPLCALMMSDIHHIQTNNKPARRCDVLVCRCYACLFFWGSWRAATVCVADVRVSAW